MDFPQQYPKMFGVRRPSKKTGAVVRFLYESKERYAIVLDPYHKGKMHAFNLELRSPEELKELLNELDKNDNYDVMYNKYLNSKYTEDRSYRTFLTNKISNLQEVYLKKSKE